MSADKNWQFDTLECTLEELADLNFTMRMEKNMKIVIIHGQSHKGSTYHIAHPRDVEHWKSKGWTEKKRP